MINSLRTLGLTSKEAAVYMALLEIGTALPVSVVAKRARVNRTTTYNILAALTEKGLVLMRRQKDLHFFEALPPEKLRSYLEEQSKKYAKLAQDADALIPQLNTFYKVQNRPRVYFYEGEEGLIRVYEETLNATGEILAYASDNANQSAIPWYFPEYYKRRAEKGIPIRALFTDTPKDRERHLRDKAELRTSRLLPKKVFNITPEVNFFDDKLMIADWKEKFGIIIESKEVSQVFKQTFELAWEAAEKYHNEIMGEKKNKKSST